MEITLTFRQSMVVTVLLSIAGAFRMAGMIEVLTILLRLYGLRPEIYNAGTHLVVRSPCLFPRKEN